jgi:hypothetical protein
MFGKRGRFREKTSTLTLDGRSSQPLSLLMIAVAPLCVLAFAPSPTFRTGVHHRGSARAGFPALQELDVDAETAAAKTAIAQSSDVSISWRTHGRAEPHCGRMPHRPLLARRLRLAESTPSGWKYIEEKVGAGALPETGDVVQVHYTVTLLSSGTALGTSRGKEPLTLALGKYDVPMSATSDRPRGHMPAYM